MTMCDKQSEWDGINVIDGYKLLSIKYFKVASETSSVKNKQYKQGPYFSDEEDLYAEWKVFIAISFFCWNLLHVAWHSISTKQFAFNVL